MRRHLQTLHSERHLKHHSRWQFTLFLKGMDLTVDEALAVWRSQFVHGKMADFQREHTYAVRHSFGLEGKMADYPPHTCERLAKNATRGDGEPGCPFAGCGQGGGGGAGHGGLGSRLSELRKEIGVLVDPVAVEDIANIAERGAPRAACKALFASVHGTSLETMRDDGILADLRFPHDWYAASAELEEEARMEGGRGGEPVGGGGGGGSALGASDEAPAGDTRRRRRRLELELESSSDEDEDDDGDARDMGELREVLTR
jgi:DNA primase large subunit